MFNDTENQTNEDTKFHKTIKSFVMRSGRMTESQRYEYDTQKDIWCIPMQTELLDYQLVYKNTNELVIEIGFGMGHATIGIAKGNPSTNYLGLEVHRPGVGRVLREIKNNDLKNLYIVEYDAVEVLKNMIPDNSVAGFHIFFPDPWPKKKHHKRRLMQKQFIEILSSKLKKDGYIYMATDWEPYAFSALEELQMVDSIKNEYTEFATPQAWRPTTNFERKGKKANRAIYELFFKKM